ncbi:3-oxoacyl-[acyl-carrier-protein] reductase FabG [Posidoniimonas polymericola]|uniref:3-oxoacyl-[acyl-carrier-protein] reductase FabG n=1 Tax=Posidoniimonas polymericola TaxID=2528002 RepID=A0A5C5YPN8_9BACT|nr:SDR family NAD(P)-dependent oxidoreductase [Posidoniimonas polymericola]TWT76921.1 3-oxoacyl-[acyl-carrier-protein] reductase FabG [Posidoniimonas polymericola]
MTRRRLDGVQAIVTGASGGIGRAIALALAERRAGLILTARRPNELQVVAAEAERRGAPPPTVVVGDLTDAGLRQRLADAVELTDKPLDLLVNNAGVSAHGLFADASPERLATIVDVNFTSTAELTRLAIPLLTGADDPAILNVGSILGHRGIPHNSEYCASKAALRAWSEALRAELAGVGIDVVLLTPGTTNTDFFSHLIDRQQDELPWGTPQGMPPEAVARAAIRGLERRRREIIPGWRAKVFVLAARLAPGLMDRAMRRYGG